MRKVSLSILLVMFCVSVFAQYSDFKASVNVFAPRAKLSAQKTLNKYFTCGIGFQFGTFALREVTNFNQTFITYEQRAIGLITEFRYYPIQGKKSAPARLFISPYLRTYRVRETCSGSLTINKETIETKSIVLNAGLSIGYQWIYKNFTAEILIGRNLSSVLSEDEKRELLISDYKSNLKDFYPIVSELSFGFILPSFKPNEVETKK